MTGPSVKREEKCKQVRGGTIEGARETKKVVTTVVTTRNGRE
jgi:hypothetical protein